MRDIYRERGERGERMVYRASSEAKAWEPDSGMDVESRASSEAEAREPNSGIDLRNGP
jgi:hypothetical protein